MSCEEPDSLLGVHERGLVVVDFVVHGFARDDGDVDEDRDTQRDAQHGPQLRGGELVRRPGRLVLVVLAVIILERGDRGSHAGVDYDFEQRETRAERVRAQRQRGCCC